VAACHDLPESGTARQDFEKRYLTDVLTRIVNGHPNRDIDQLLPWAYGKQELKAAA